MAKKYRDVRRALLAAGWQRVRQVGSHEQWRSPDGKRRVTLAGKPNKEVPAGTLTSIRDATGLEELR